MGFTVKTGPFKSFGVTPNPAEPQAGQAFEVKLAAWDEFHNLITTYARTHKLRYEGAEASPSGKAPEYSTATEPTFAGGEATVTGFRFYKATATNLKVTEETTGHEGTGAFTVKALAPKTLALSAAATEVGSGQADALTITALDEYLNPATSYGGAGGETKNLTFEGAGASPNGSEPTVANEAAAAVKFGTATAIRFTNGKASVSGTANGVLTLYKVEEAHVKVKEGALNNGARARDQGQGGRSQGLQALRARTRGTRSRPGLQRHAHRARRGRQRRHHLRRRRAARTRRSPTPGRSPRPRARRPNTRHRRRR